MALGVKPLIWTLEIQPRIAINGLKRTVLAELLTSRTPILIRTATPIPDARRDGIHAELIIRTYLLAGAAETLVRLCVARYVGWRNNAIGKVAYCCCREERKMGE